MSTQQICVLEELNKDLCVMAILLFDESFVPVFMYSLTLFIPLKFTGKGQGVKGRNMQGTE